MRKPEQELQPALRFLKNTHRQVAAKYILQPTVLSTMWVKLLSVVADFCFSPFLVTDRETASEALEKSSPSSQDPQHPTSTGKCQPIKTEKKKSSLLGKGQFSVLISMIFF